MRLALLAVVVTATLAGPAHAFVRKVNEKTGKPVFWRESCVPVTIYLNGFDTSRFKLMTDADIEKSIAAAAHAWSTDAVSCLGGGSPSIEIVPTMAPAGAAPAPAAYDAKNSLIFRTDVWAKSGISGPMRDYAPEGLAITTVTSEGDGHIVDVDVEVNATNALDLWMNLDPGVTVPRDQGETMYVYDLQNALTHEFGHFIGLEHTCFVPDEPGSNFDVNGVMRPKDDQQEFIPNCDPKAPAEVQRTVMFNTSPPQQTSKRTLAPDDINGVCTIYPASRATPVCALDQSPPGCAVAPSGRRRPGAAFAAFFGLGLAALGAVVRRRRVSGRGRARA